MSQKESDRDTYGCSKAKYKARIRSAMREVWQWSKPRREAFKRAKFKENGITYQKCELCGKRYRLNQKESFLKKDGTVAKRERSCLVCHHKEEIPDVFDPNFMTRMFCEQYKNPVDGYLILCNDCHTNIHNGGDKSGKSFKKK